MKRTVDNEVYLDTDEVMKLFSARKNRFYSSIRPHLRPRYFDALKKPWYRESEAIALKEGKSVRMAEIPIMGMFDSWAAYAQQEYGATSELLSISTDAAKLPEDISRRFKLSSAQEFVTQTRRSVVDRMPICVWVTYYPTTLVSREEVKGGHVTELIRDKHGLVPDQVVDIYLARETTFDELNLFQLPNDTAALILQRVVYAGNGTLMWVSDMTLLGNWFIHKQVYSMPLAVGQ